MTKEIRFTTKSNTCIHTHTCKYTQTCVISLNGPYSYTVCSTFNGCVRPCKSTSDPQGSRGPGCASRGVSCWHRKPRGTLPGQAGVAVPRRSLRFASRRSCKGSRKRVLYLKRHTSVPQELAHDFIRTKALCTRFRRRASVAGPGIQHGPPAAGGAAHLSWASREIRQGTEWSAETNRAVSVSVVLKRLSDCDLENRSLLRMPNFYFH